MSSSVYAPTPFPARPADTPIRVYQALDPGCPYEEVGMVRAASSSRFDSLQDMLDAARKRARAMGGDAIIGLSLQDRANGAVVANRSDVSATLSRTEIYTGTVVRFTEATCRPQG